MAMDPDVVLVIIILIVGLPLCSVCILQVQVYDFEIFDSSFTIPDLNGSDALDVFR